MNMGIFNKKVLPLIIISTSLFYSWQVVLLMFILTLLHKKNENGLMKMLKNCFST